MIFTHNMILTHMLWKDTAFSKESSRKERLCVTPERSRNLHGTSVCGSEVFPSNYHAFLHLSFPLPQAAFPPRKHGLLRHDKNSYLLYSKHTIRHFTWISFLNSQNDPARVVLFPVDRSKQNKNLRFRDLPSENPRVFFFFLDTHIPEGNEMLILQLFLFKYGLTLNSSRWSIRSREER